jgi:aconitate hydratase
MEYAAKGIPSLVFAGEEYGTGSSRDWAAKGTRLLGVAAVVARSFERIHRSNLVGMGVLPLQFKDGEHLGTIPIIGDELFDLMVPEEGLRPLQDLDLVITRADGRRHTMSVRLRIDTPIEVEYFRHGGILPYALREVLK